MSGAIGRAVVTGEFRSGVVDSEDTQAKVFFVTVAIGTVLDQLSLIVGASQRSRGGGIVILCQLSGPVFPQRLRHRTVAGSHQC